MNKHRPVRLVLKRHTLGQLSTLALRNVIGGDAGTLSRWPPTEFVPGEDGGGGGNCTSGDGGPP